MELLRGNDDNINSVKDRFVNKFEERKNRNYIYNFFAMSKYDYKKYEFNSLFDLGNSNTVNINASDACAIVQSRNDNFEIGYTAVIYDDGSVKDKKMCNNRNTNTLWIFKCQRDI